MKHCARCNAEKATADFPNGKQWADGLYPYCRACKREVQRADHAKHREARNAKVLAAYYRNPEPYKARALAAYHADPVAKMAAVRTWQAANREKVRVYGARDSKAHPERTRASWRKHHALKLGATILPITAAALTAKVAYWGGRCWMCRGEYEAIDHVKPLAKGGAHVLANLRPVCRPCNSRKRDRWPLALAG